MKAQKKGTTVQTPGERKVERILKVSVNIIQRIFYVIYGASELFGWCYVVKQAGFTAYDMYRNGWSVEFKAQGVWGIWADILCACQVGMLADIARAQTTYLMTPSGSKEREIVYERRRSVMMHSGARVVVAFGIEALSLARRGELAGYSLLTLALVGGIAEITRFLALFVSSFCPDKREPFFFYILRKIFAIVAIPICSVAQGIMLFNIGAQLSENDNNTNTYTRIVATTVRVLILALGFLVAVIVFRRALLTLIQAFRDKSKQVNDENQKEKSE